MYKRYMFPGENPAPLTKYMATKLRKLDRNANVMSSRRGILPQNDNLMSSSRGIFSRNDHDSNNDVETVEAKLENDEAMECIRIEENMDIQKPDDDDFFRLINDQIIHPNLQCKTTDAIIMILAYFLKHNLTWVALEDLLQLFHNILGEQSNLPKTKYFFKKCFGQTQRAVFHFYCKNCLLYLDTYDKLKILQDEKDKAGDKSCETCTVCATNYSIKKMNEGHFFVQLPLREQIQKKISENSDILDYNTTSNSNDITDIFDGELYKSLRLKVGDVPFITFTLNTDGVKVFKSKKKGSLWPLQMFINEVPPNKRFKTDNIILSGIWFGKDPNFELYLQPLIKEMNNLDDEKITVHINNITKRLTVRVLFITSDLPGKAKFLKMKQYNGEFGCSYCLHPGFKLGDSTTSKYLLSLEKYRLRTHESTVALMRLFASTGIGSLGITGVSPVIGFKDYDIIRGTVIDYLHCILEGVTSLVTDQWFDSENHREPYYINPRARELVEKNIKCITPLKSFSIKPRTIGEKEFWKAHDFKYWLLFYAVPCLKDILKPSYLNHFTLLSEATFIFLKTRVTPSEYEKASKNLLKFHNDFEKLYGKQNMMHNVHLLKHISKCVKDCGLLWGYSMFNFESNNGLLVKNVKGTTDVEQQIITKYSFNNVLSSLKSLSESTFNYIERTQSMRLKKSEKIGQITLFGSPHKHRLDANQKRILLRDAEYIMAYYKFFYGNDVYFSSTYERAEQTNDTFVLLKDERVGQITLIFKDEEIVFLLLKILNIESVQHFPAHIKKISQNVASEFEVIKAEEVKEKLLLISTTKESYLSAIPNQYEGD